MIEIDDSFEDTFFELTPNQWRVKLMESQAAWQRKMEELRRKQLTFLGWTVILMVGATDKWAQSPWFLVAAVGLAGWNAGWSIRRERELERQENLIEATRGLLQEEIIEGPCKTEFYLEGNGIEIPELVKREKRSRQAAGKSRMPIDPELN